MKTQISVPIATAQFVELLDFLRENGDERDPVAVIELAIEYWMQNASWKPELLARIASESHGYTWRYKDHSIFMPHGTDIRMQYKGKYHYAKVEGDEIKFEGAAVSPSTFANMVTKSSRNAWRDLWIKRPSDKEWIFADDCRRVEQLSAAAK